MTYTGHMKTISISNLKAHLSATIKAVNQGINFIVMDRDHPVAEIIPYSKKLKLSVRAPMIKGKKIDNKFKGLNKFDPVTILMEDRNGIRY
jgi:antitoxin (DNA-binding transcriptional repressor) of toxin-antitoxin stability system